MNKLKYLLYPILKFIVYLYIPLFRKLPTNINGLKYTPSFIFPFLDNKDRIAPFFWIKDVPIEFSKQNQLLLKDILIKNKDKINNVLEIGVSRSVNNSSTKIIFDHKCIDCKYLGVDIEDKSFLDNPNKNINTIKVDSINRKTVFEKMKSLGINYFDLILIDGWHSVSSVINDWHYSQLLSENGIVILHDTSCHPGPFLLFGAIDEALYEKQKFFNDSISDWGMAVIQKKSLDLNITNIKNMTRGWYIGNFKPTAYNTKDFEVAYMKHKRGELWASHYHKKATEINLLVKGSMMFDNKQINAGEIFIFQPDQIARPIFLTNCELIVVKVPSSTNDKFLIEDSFT